LFFPSWAPIDNAEPTAVGMPQEYDASKEWKGKKVVLVSVPGAFTPGCQARHLPPYIANVDKILEKGVDLVAVIASNDAWVMSAWGKVNGVKDSEKIVFLSDSKTMYSKQIGWMAGMGDRNGRWAMVIEKDGTISYAEQEDDPRKVTVCLCPFCSISRLLTNASQVSGAETLLSKL
jgi:alkyl hydroperoxide reductase 1